uniref:Uncharacterized protein n=1 Tax=Anguilla anguilla TaxID=7936 RepID=A0A0E9THC7_ANGAN
MRMMERKMKRTRMAKKERTTMARTTKPDKGHVPPTSFPIFSY